MPTKRAPTRLAALLRLLEQHDVTSYEDGVIRLTLGPRSRRREIQEPTELQHAAPGARPQPEKPARKVYDAVDLAVNGIEYDPDEGSEAPGERN